MRTLLPAALSIIASVASATHSGDDLPVREVTVFKDGHAMVYREGSLRTTPAGAVVLDDLPQPVLGTFWAFENEPGASLSAVRAGAVDVDLERTAQTLADLLALSVGKRIVWLHRGNQETTGTLVALLPNPTDPKLALIEHDKGGREAVPLEQLYSVRFIEGVDPEAPITTPSRANRLTLELAWDEPREPAGKAHVGVMYLQKGIRWIPSYRVTLLDDGKTARIEMQASLVNDLIELDDATVHLVVGVPRFAFDHTPDPIALNDQFAQLGGYFQRQAGTAGAFSNALMAQSARMSESRDYAGGRPNAEPAMPPELTGAESNEDLYVFSIDHVTLGVGERMILPISVAEVPVEAVYKLTLPAAPPANAWSNFSTDQQRQIADLLDRPLARHVLRLTNTTDHPFTTAPALIVRNGKPLAQGLMTYTAKKGTTDLEVTDAVDIQIEVDERESGRDPKALVWDSNQYARIDFSASIELTNRKAYPVTVEITKHSFGLPTSASDGGEAAALGMFQDSSLWNGSPHHWWTNYGWPWWWHRLNGVSRFTWTVELEPGESLTRTAEWHYFWR